MYEGLLFGHPFHSNRTASENLYVKSPRKTWHRSEPNCLGWRAAKSFFFALCVKHQQRNWKCFMNLHDFSNVHSKKKFSGAYLAAEVLRPPPLTTLERNNRTNCITKEGKLRKYLQMKWTYSGVRVHRMHRQHNKESIVRLVCYVFLT